MCQSFEDAERIRSNTRARTCTRAHAHLLYLSDIWIYSQLTAPTVLRRQSLVSFFLPPSPSPRPSLSLCNPPPPPPRSPSLFQSIGIIHSGAHHNPLNQTRMQKRAVNPRDILSGSKHAGSQNVSLMSDYRASINGSLFAAAPHQRLSVRLLSQTRSCTKLTRPVPAGRWTCFRSSVLNKGLRADLVFIP